MNSGIQKNVLGCIPVLGLLGFLLAGCDPGKAFESRTDLELRSDGSGRLIQTEIRVSEHDDKFSEEELAKIREKASKDTSKKYTVTDHAWTLERTTNFKSIAELEFDRVGLSFFGSTQNDQSPFIIELKTVKSNWFGFGTPVRRVILTEYVLPAGDPEATVALESINKQKTEDPVEYKKLIDVLGSGFGSNGAVYSIIVPGRIEQVSELHLDHGNIVIRGGIDGSAATWRVPTGPLAETLITEGPIVFWVDFSGVMTAPDGKSKLKKEEPKPVEKAPEKPTSEPVPIPGKETPPVPEKGASQSETKPLDIDSLVQKAREAYDQKDFGDAAVLYRQAAEKGSAEAQYNLGVMHEEGEGVLQNDQEAVNWYRLAADQGHSRAQNDLGILYNSGRGVPKDEREAVRLFRLAADQGQIEAKFNLARSYALGTGVPKDLEGAQRLFDEIGEQGGTKYQYIIGTLYKEGNDLPKNDQKAMKWFRRAAVQGMAEAQFELGLYYESGTDVPRDVSEAARWYRKAADQGNEDAKRRLQEIQHNGSTSTRPPAAPVRVAGPVDPQAIPAELHQTADLLVQNGPIHLSGDCKCFLGDSRGGMRDAYTQNDAETLLRIAAEKDIFIFVHGFDVNKYGGRPTAEEVEDIWSWHLQTLRRRPALADGSSPPYAACLFRVDTRSGFGEQQPRLGNFLFGLRWLTDDPALFDPQRRITLIGHSAGGNFVKQGLLRFQSNLRASNVGPEGLAPTRMRMIFLATPHQGTDMTHTAEAGAALYRSMEEVFKIRNPRSHEDYSANRWRDTLAGQYEFMTNSKGARQLRPNSPDLRELNQAFISGITSNLEIWNFAGTGDIVVPPDSAKLPVGRTFLVGGIDHAGFLAPYGQGEFAAQLVRLYQP